MPTIVRVDEIVFVPINSEPLELEAEGVTACICLTLYGRTADGPFIGMYHWSGFNNGGGEDEEEVSENIYGLVCQLVTQARSQLGLDENAQLFLDNLFVIGGERQQEMLSGTEVEVNALENYIRAQCEEEFIFSDVTGFYFYNYLTSGEDTLTVKMNHITRKPHWFVSEVENQVYMDTDTDSFSSPDSPNLYY